MNSPQQFLSGKLFAELAELIHHGEDEQTVHQSIVDACLRSVSGCDHASLMLRTGKQFRTAATSDDIATQIDVLERALDDGPCVDAIEDEPMQFDTDITDYSTWPRLAEQVVAHTPVRGMIGIRLLIDNRKVGALDIFSDTPGALTEESVAQGAVVAAFGSVALMTYTARRQADTLSRGLDSNREIGKAIGLLMAAHKFNEDEAFELLRQTSQNLNMKLIDVARRVIDGQQSQYQRS